MQCGCGKIIWNVLFVTIKQDQQNYYHFLPNKKTLGKDTKVYWYKKAGTRDGKEPTNCYSVFIQQRDTAKCPTIQRYITYMGLVKFSTIFPNVIKIKTGRIFSS